MLIRPISREDYARIIELNTQSVEMLSPLDVARLDYLVRIADDALVVVVDANVEAFALSIRSGREYDSVNYCWFAERIEKFVYVDRVVVAPLYRRRGLAALLYDSIEGSAVTTGRVVCEVNIEPPNEPSLAFHAKRRFVEVGRLRSGEGSAIVMLEKRFDAPPEA